MAKGVSIQVEGLDKLIKKFGTLPKNVETEFDALIGSVANGFANRAQNDAPTDNRRMANAIGFERKSVMNWQVASPVNYSVFLEFGTKTRTQVPADLAAYASQFKGIKSTGDPKKAIYDWCKRKGIPQEAWWPIFISVMTKGIHPHPFFFKQIPQAQAEIDKELPNIVKEAMK